MAEPKFDFDFGSLPTPPAKEGTVHKLVRWATDPIADSIPGLKDKLEHLAQPGLNDSPTMARVKGFLGGAGEAVKPGHIAALATLPAMAAEVPAGIMGANVPGLGGAAGNVLRSVMGINKMRQIAGAIPAGVHALNAVGSGAMGLEGAINTAQDASDPKKGKLDIAKDVLDTGLGALGGVAGIRGFSKTRNLTKAMGDVQQTHDLASQTGLRVALNDLQKIGVGTPTTADEIAKHAAIANELKSKPGGKIADAIFGEDKGVPKDPSHVELLNAQEQGKEYQADRIATDKKNLDKEFQTRIRAKENHLDAAQKDIERSGAQEDRNYKAGQKYIEGQLVQDTRNDKSVNAFQQKDAAGRAADIKAETKYNVGKAKAAEAAGTQNAKMDDAAIAQADADRQANAIEGLKDRLTEQREPSTIRETVSGPGEHGGTARATFMRTEPPPPDEEGTVAGAIGGKPVSPTSKAPRGPATSKGFNSPEDAQKAADATGGAFSVAQNPNDNLHYLVPEGQQPPWNDAVQQSIRPYNQLTATEQKAIKPLLRQARKAGVAPDRLESLGDELADKLGMIKAGRESADDTNSTLESAIKAVKNSGSPLLDDGSEEIGKLRQFLRQQGVSTRGVLTKTGKYRSLDQAGEDLKGVLPGFDNAKETSLLDHLQSLKPETEQSAVDELISKHKGNWWEKPTAEVHDYTEGDIPTVDVEPPSAKPEGEVPRPPKVEEIPSDSAEPEGPADTSFNPDELEKQSFTPGGQGPEMSVPEFAQALSQEGKKPLVPLPEQTFNLTGQDAPRAPEPSLFDAPQEPAPQALNMGVPDEGAIAQGGVSAPEAPQVQPEAPTQVGGGAIPARLFKSQLEAAGPHYGETQAAYKAGEAPKEAARTAGAAAQRINKEAQAAEAAKERAAQVASVQEELADPKTDPLTKSMLQRWLSENSGFGGSQLGSGSTSMALRGAGATIGGLGGYQTDPLDNKPASAVAGGALGFFSPELASGLAKLAPAMGEGAVNSRDRIANIAKTINQFHNTALLSPLSVAKKAAGDIGGLTLAALEHKERTGDILKQFLTTEGRANLANNFKEGFYGPDQEKIGGLDLPNKILNSNINPMSWSGKMMGGLTKATKGVLGEAGFSPQEQRYYTLTDYPQYKTTEHLYNAIRQGDFLKHLVPFARVGVNRLERGYEYSPIGGLANLLMKSHSSDPGGTITKAALGSAVTAGAYALTPEDFVKNHPIAASVGSSLAGPLGLPVLAGMALKNAHQKQGDPFFSRPSGSKLSDATQEIARDVPGLRIIEDVSGKSPTGFARNYLSGYTNVTRPLALANQYLQEGNMDDPDLSSKDLTPGQQIYNRALSNIPGIRETLPKKETKITGKPKFDFKF